MTLPYILGPENFGWVHAIERAVTTEAESDKVILRLLITQGTLQRLLAPRV